MKVARRARAGIALAFLAVAGAAFAYGAVAREWGALFVAALLFVASLAAWRTRGDGAWPHAPGRRVGPVPAPYATLPPKRALFCLSASTAGSVSPVR